MKRKLPRRYLRRATVALAALILAGWFLPYFLSVERYRRVLSNALETSLGRRVTFASMSFHLLPRPGFTIQDVLIEEDPRFGIEPFARIDRVDCDLRWESLWRGRLALSGLDLETPRFNVVRVSGEGWNIESILSRQGYSSSVRSSSHALRVSGPVELAVEEGQVNFKMDGVKEPFVIGDLKAQVIANPATRSLRFDLLGTPSRTDLMTPSPGPVEISGKWSPGLSRTPPLTARLELRDSLLYSWLPLITGRNPEIYGLLNGDVGIEGTRDRLKAQGQVRVTQVHRWELLPPTTSMPVNFQFEISADRNRQRVSIDQMNVRFAAAHLHLTGSLLRAQTAVRMDLVLALQHSRLEDLGRMASRLSGRHLPPGVSGEVDGLLAIRGPQGDEQFSGFLNARNLLLRTPAGNFPVPLARLRIDQNTARLMPVRVKLAPHLILKAEGFWGPMNTSMPRPMNVGRRPHTHPQKERPSMFAGERVYRLTLSSNSASLHEVATFTRAHGISFARKLDLTGQGNGTFVLTGKGWPLSPPKFSGRIELDHAQLVAPGLTEILKFPKAQIQLDGDHIVASPVFLVIGGSNFSGSLDHRGSRNEPWLFKAQCDHLTIEQAALWFEALGHRQPASLLARIPGLASLASRLQAGRDILGSLHAEGTFQANSVSYRQFNLTGFQSEVQISNRKVRISAAKFKVAGGNGQGLVTVNLKSVPARISAQIHLAHIQLADLAPHFPIQLRGTRGFLSAGGDFAARGLSRSEMASSLSGHAQIDLHNISLGSFDPVQAAAMALNWGPNLPAHSVRMLPLARFNLLIQNGDATLSSDSFNAGNGTFKVDGSIQPGGKLDLILHADLSRAARRRMASVKGPDDPNPPAGDFHIGGSYLSPKVQRVLAVSKSNP